MTIVDIYKERLLRIIPRARVGYEMIRTLRSDNGDGDGDGNLRSLGRGSLCDVGVSVKIEILIL